MRATNSCSSRLPLLSVSNFLGRVGWTGAGKVSGVLQTTMLMMIILIMAAPWWGCTWWWQQPPLQSPAVLALSTPLPALGVGGGVCKEISLTPRACQTKPCVHEAKIGCYGDLACGQGSWLVTRTLILPKGPTKVNIANSESFADTLQVSQHLDGIFFKTHLKVLSLKIFSFSKIVI